MIEQKKGLLEKEPIKTNELNQIFLSELVHISDLVLAIWSLKNFLDLRPA